MAISLPPIDDITHHLWKTDAPIPAPGPIRQSGSYHQVLGPAITPLTRVKPGAKVVNHTADCFNGRLTRVEEAVEEA